MAKMKRAGGKGRPKEIDQVVRQIVDNFHPRKIILFGSYAYGKPEKDSDADLMVIMDTDERPLHMAGKIAAAIDHPIALDILVYTPAEIERRFKFGDGLVHDAMDKGTVLYEEPAH